ncbi:hypothetical protein [Pseudonocardia sp. ICBG1293]|nr:hypothetical protein [Pseudonocardia sp. ICBG1293]
MLGAGKPLFDGGGHDPRSLRLVRSTPYRSGVIVAEYTRTP